MVLLLKIATLAFDVFAIFLQIAYDYVYLLELAPYLPKTLLIITGCFKFMMNNYEPLKISLNDVSVLPTLCVFKLDLHDVSRTEIN